MKKFVKISAVLLSAMLALTGCSNKELEEANATIAQLTEENESLNAQVTELLQDMEDNSGISTDSETTISSYSTTPEVNTVDDLNSIVHIDGLLEYTNSYQAPNTSTQRQLERQDRWYYLLLLPPHGCTRYNQDVQYGFRGRQHLLSGGLYRPIFTGTPT